MSNQITTVKKRAFIGRRTLFITAFISPALLLILFFAYWPIVSTINYSFRSWDGFSLEMTWVGLANYLRLFQDPNFHNPSN